MTAMRYCRVSKMVDALRQFQSWMSARAPHRVKFAYDLLAKKNSQFLEEYFVYPDKKRFYYRQCASFDFDIYLSPYLDAICNLENTQKLSLFHLVDLVFAIPMGTDPTKFYTVCMHWGIGQIPFPEEGLLHIHMANAANNHSEWNGMCYSDYPRFGDQEWLSDQITDYGKHLDGVVKMFHYVKDLNATKSRKGVTLRAVCKKIVECHPLANMETAIVVAQVLIRRGAIVHGFLAKDGFIPKNHFSYNMMGQWFGISSTDSVSICLFV